MEMNAFNATVKLARVTFFGGDLPRRNRFTRSYCLSWATCPANDPPADYVLRDFFAEAGFEPASVIVTAGGCSVHFDPAIMPYLTF
jgi:hypothetical protein